ncbi:hypothetical protein ACOSQ2_008278 [Xanthoceras sorbifolium]
MLQSNAARPVAPLQCSAAPTVAPLVPIAQRCRPVAPPVAPSTPSVQTSLSHLQGPPHAHRCLESAPIECEVERSYACRPKSVPNMVIEFSLRLQF